MGNSPDHRCPDPASATPPAAAYGTVLLDPAGRVRSWDAGAERITARTAADMIGRPLAVLYPPEDVAARPTAGLAAADHHGGWEDVGWHLRGDASRVWVHVLVTALRAQDGRLRGFSVLLRDVCGQRAPDGPLRQLAQAMEYAVEGIAQVGPAGRFVSVNSAYAAPLGRTPAELVGLSWESAVHPDDRPVLRAAYQRMVDAGKAVAEVRGLRTDGTVFHKDVTLVAIRGAGGDYQGNFCFVKDLSDRRRADDERRKADAELRQSRELLSSVLDSSLEGVIALRAVRDPAAGGPVVDFEFQLLNAAAEQLLGRRSADLLGRPPAHGRSRAHRRHRPVRPLRPASSPPAGRSTVEQCPDAFGGLADLAPAGRRLPAGRRRDRRSRSPTSPAASGPRPTPTATRPTSEAARGRTQRQAAELAGAGPEQLDVARRAAEQAATSPRATSWPT